MKLEVGYETASGNLMSMTVRTKCMHRTLVPVYDCDILELCMHNTKCKGYNGGCPPYAPPFDNLKPSKKVLYIISVEFDMAAAMHYSGRLRGVAAPGLILTYADRITLHYTQRLLRKFENAGFYTLGLSNCPGCRPRDCNVNYGGKCTKPKKRRYSVEAVGISCNDLHWDMYNEALPWWHAANGEYMPAAMYRYAVVFVDSSDILYYDMMLHAYAIGDKSYTEDIPEFEYDKVVLRIPYECYDAGEKYYAYKMPLT